MLKKVIMTSLISVILISVSVAQLVGSFPTNTEEQTKSGFSLFDPSKFNMTQSYSLMYSSSKYGSQSLGLYLNSIEYQISDPLKVRVDLAYYHNPGALVGNNNSTLSNSGSILPGLALSWKPSENFHLYFNYSQVPGYYYSPYDRYSTDYWYTETGRGF